MAVNPVNPAVAQPAIKCVGCPCVPGVRVGCSGDPKAKIVIVVDGPGTAELRYRTPLSGAVEQLLVSNLPAGFDLYTDAYIIPATQCRMPTIEAANKAKAFKLHAVSQCRARTLEQLWEHPRDLVIAMGSSAAMAVTGDMDFKITQRRGIVQDVLNPVANEFVKMYPILHPGFLLRGGNLQVFKIDLIEALKVAKTGVSRQELWQPPETKELETADQVWELAQELADEAAAAGLNYALVTGDFETSGFNPFEDSILVFGFYQRSKDIAWMILPEFMEDSVYKRAVTALFTHPEIHWIWQNGKFDIRFAWLNSWIPYGFDIIHEDTLLLSYTLNETAKQHDLDEQAKNRLGAPEHKAEIKQWVRNKKDSYARIPRPKLLEYLGKDLKKTDQLFQETRELVAADPDCELLYTETLIPSSRLLCEIELAGIGVDFEYVRINRFGATQADVDNGLVSQKALDSGEEIGLEAEIAICIAKIEELAGYSVNPNSPDQVKELLYERLGLKIKNKIPLDTSKETLERLPPHPVVKLIREYRSLVKMLSTYVIAIEKKAVNGRIHTTFKLHITPTGRLSSSDPNIQNIPRLPRWKRMYAAAPGKVFVESDYNTAELRALAALSKDEVLTAIFLDDKRNLHDEVSIEMYGKDFTVDQRIRAKAINFGIPYGREAYSISVEFDITPEEAQRLIDAWLARFPQAAVFLKETRGAPLRNESLISVFGRKRRPGIVSAERLHGLMNEFSNFHFQSIISDFNIHAARLMLPDLKKCGAMIANLVHDSNVVECPDKEPIIRDVRDIMRHYMEDTPKLWLDTPITFSTDFKVGKHWGYLRSYKG